MTAAAEDDEEEDTIAEADKAGTLSSALPLVAASAEEGGKARCVDAHSCDGGDSLRSIDDEA